MGVQAFVAMLDPLVMTGLGVPLRQNWAVTLLNLKRVR